MRRRIVAGGLSVVASLVLASPAMAEASWTSYWYRVLPGVDTRQWTDSNSDVNSTYHGIAVTY